MQQGIFSVCPSEIDQRIDGKSLLYKYSCLCGYFVCCPCLLCTQHTFCSTSMTALQSLYFSYNGLTGTIPSTISSMTALQSLYFSYNSLTGTIPRTISSMTALHFFDLRNNYLTMGTATTVPPSTFSNNTLNHGNVLLDSNCLAFSYGGYSTSATHCLTTSGELI